MVLCYIWAVQEALCNDKKYFPVNETIFEAVWEEEGVFSKEDIIKKLGEKGICPGRIAPSTVKTVISNMSGRDIKLVEGGSGRRAGYYRNKVDYRLRIILKDLNAIKERVEELIQEQHDSE